MLTLLSSFPCSGSTLRHFVCEYKGSVCPAGYAWVVDGCVAVVRNGRDAGTSGGLDQVNCAGRVQKVGVSVGKISEDEVRE